MQGLCGGLLIGGGSRRMGRAKQLLVHRGTTLAERAATALAACCHEIFLLGAGEIPPTLSDLPRLLDATLPSAQPAPETAPETATSGAGPLAGLLAALRHRPDAAWVFAPCDLPQIRGEAVEWLIAQRRPHRAVVLTRRADNAPVDPLFSLYEPRSLDLLERLAASGERAPRAIEGQPEVEVVVPPPALADCWIGVNTPEELRGLEAP